MRSIFADTSYFVALAVSRDQFHQAADNFSRCVRTPLLTSSAVVLELGSHFSAARNRPAFGRLLEILDSPAVDLIHVDADLQRRAIDLFADRPDKDWSLADCISFILMRDRGITEAASSDIHFEQAGFTALLRTPSAKL